MKESEDNRDNACLMDEMELMSKSDYEEFSELKTKEVGLLKKLEEKRKKIFQLKVEATSWESVAKSKVLELRNLEMKLNDGYDKIWRGRDEFCERVDRFLESDAIRIQPTDSENMIREMRDCLSYEEDSMKILTKKLNDLKEEREKLLESNDSERKRLEEWIKVTRDRCMELNRRINEKRNSSLGKINFRNNQLFSIVNLEDVKKLSKI